MQNEFVMLVGYEVGEILMFNFKIVEKVMDSYLKFVKMIPLGLPWKLKIYFWKF